MLKLTNIVKEYSAGDNTVTALRGVDLTFRESEFVSILGPSGCGKTTLLNIIGGLDHYTDGDLFINGVSTKEYGDSDWDTYRNHSVGFVFQSYNLIPHQSVLSNVELALTLSGVSKSERRKRAVEALEKVGLADQIHKKPNQMSGGQMQRVAIARALVNNPHILLADEPTGALDSETSLQIMELLKEIAKEKLVIMVTHNPELAEEYSTRIIRLLDGKITGDSNPYTEDISAPEKPAEKKRRDKTEKKPSMSFFTALSLSLNNLMTKKARTILTSFAGSIGIIGIALILALSNGIQTYIDEVQEDTLASYPITIEAEQVDMTALISTFMGINAESQEHPLDKVYSSPVLNELLNTMTNAEVSINNLKDFKAYLETNPNNINDLITAIDYTYDFDFNVFVKDSDGKIVESDAMKLMQESIGMEMDMGFAENSQMGMNQIKIYQQMLADKNGKGINDLVLSQYDVIHGSWPQNYNEVVVVVNDNNEISDVALLALGLTTLDNAKDIWNNVESGEEVDTEVKSWSYEDICNLEFTLVPSCNYYSLDPLTNTYIDISTTESGITYMYDNGIKMKVSGIIRPREDASSAMLTGSVAYTKELTDYVINYTANSDIVKAQLEKPDIDVLNGLPFKPDDYKEPDTATKAADFKEYVKTLTSLKKAELYKAIASVPTDEYLKQAVDGQMATMTREYIETMMIDSFAAETGMNAETIREYVAKMTDDELFAQVRTMLTDMIKEQYAEQMTAQLAAVPEAQLAAMLDSVLAKYSEEQMAAVYDAHMPPTHSDSNYSDNLGLLGKVSLDSPYTINIYAATFEAKDNIADEIKNYNSTVSEDDQISYTDYVALMMSSITTIINVISYVLIAFVAISLIVSSIMIGIITYISVLERTKEIGILRAIGASKRDISRVFNAEALTIGFASGMFGVVVTVLFCLPINAIIQNLSGIENIAAVLPLIPAIVLVGISMFLTFIAGLLPSRIAAKKDPVEALRSE